MLLFVELHYRRGQHPKSARTDRYGGAHRYPQRAPTYNDRNADFICRDAGQRHPFGGYAGSGDVLLMPFADQHKFWNGDPPEIARIDVVVRLRRKGPLRDIRDVRGGGEALRQGADPPASQKNQAIVVGLSPAETRGGTTHNDNRLLVTQQN
jgi:hypothetical protein